MDRKSPRESSTVCYMKDGIVGDFIMWSFLGAGAVLALTKGSGLATAVGTVTTPLEYETSLIATAGGGTAAAPTTQAKK